MGKVQRWIDELLEQDTDECIIWPFARNNKGYGNLRVDRQYVSAHRYICIQVHDQPPSSEHVASHSCGNGFGGCVNPKHLRWKTYSENEQEKKVHGTNNYYGQYGNRDNLGRLIPLEEGSA